MTNASFIKRLLAYLVDVIIVTIVGMIIFSSLNAIFNFNNTKTLAYQEKMTSIMEKASVEENREKSIEYISELSKLTEDNYRDMALESIPTTLITFILKIVYFIYLVFVLKGQTLGKKLFNIKVVTVEGKEPTLKQLIMRGIIIYSLYQTFLELILVFVIENKTFYQLSAFLSGLSVVIVFVSAILIIFNNDKRGIHDKIAKTKVILDE